MICDKCGSKLRNSKKCGNCGFDNSNVDFTFKEVEMRASVIRSLRLTVFLCLMTLMGVISVISSLLTLVRGEYENPYMRVLLIFLAVESAFRIVLCVFMFRLKKWALKTYIGLTVVNCVIDILTGNFIAVVLVGLLIYFVFRNDWENFE